MTAVRLTATALAPAAPGTVKFRASPARNVLTLRVSSTRVGAASGWNRPAVAMSAAV